MLLWNSDRHRHRLRSVWHSFGLTFLPGLQQFCPANLLTDNSVILDEGKLSQEAQLSLTNRVTHFCKCNGVTDPRKHAPLYMCYHAEFNRFTSTGVGISMGNLQNWGLWDPAPLQCPSLFRAIIFKTVKTEKENHEMRSKAIFVVDQKEAEC